MTARVKTRADFIGGHRAAVDGRAWELVRAHYLRRLRLSGDSADLLDAAVLKRRGSVEGLRAFRRTVAEMARELRALQRAGDA